MLSRKQVEDIERQAEETLGLTESSNGHPSPASGMVSLPVDLNAILKSLELKSERHILRPAVSGSYKKDAHEIKVNRLDSRSRQAFTIAHEIGHAVLHGDRPDDTFWRSEANDPSCALTQEEQQANWFAASLLMPRKSVEAAWGRVRDLGELKDLFGVSAQAMEYRLKNLRLIA